MEATDADVREAAMSVQKLWWVWLVIGVAWIIISLVILRFNTTSLTTVGIIIGLMVLFAGLQDFFIAAVVDKWKWLWIVFGILFVIAGIICLAYPKNTFKAVADMLGFIFLLVGIFWIIESFSIKDTNSLWWFNLIAGILMVGIAFWTSGQFLTTKGYTLIIFAGIWALLHGITDIVRAFEVKKLDQMVE
jgi:uncharacterized membrane protein HdeD (DUF308 family)